MAIRQIFFIGFFTCAPLPVIGQNLDAGDIINLGNQLLRGVQQPQATSPQQTPATPQVRIETQGAPTYDAGQIYETQSILSRLGYDPGPADGLMGPSTERAIRKFQVDRGLAQDGQPSTALLVQLNAVSGTQTQLSTFNQGVPQPSFDCNRAGNPVEFAICGSVILADKDRQLLGAYKQALAETGDQEQLRLQQRAWLHQRDRCGGSEACIADAMDTRIAELQRVVTSAGAPATHAQTSAPPTAVQTAPMVVQGASAPVASPSVRQDSILVHADGGLMVPGPMFKPGTPEFQQYRAFVRYLLHAASGAFPDEMVPAENPSLLAEMARDYLPLADVRPYLCTSDEMNSRAPDCMSFGDASGIYSMGGGQLDPPGDAPREAAFLWWRGANEFERRRNIAEFIAENGLRDRIIATAPETPVRLVYSVQSVVDSYDFEASAFPVLPIGGARTLTPPGSKSAVIDLADIGRPIPVPPAAAENLLGELQRNNSGAPVIYIGVAIDLTPDPPRGRQPQWTAQTIFAGYFIDAELNRPLETAVALSGGARSPASQPPSNDAATGNVVSGSAMREFQLKLEDGRIVIDFSGYREPTATAREGVLKIVASAARDIVNSFEEGANKINIPLLNAILNDETKVRFFDDRNRLVGKDEFAVQRNRETFRNEIEPRLIAAAPRLPIPMRLYLNATLGEYDFDRQGFPVGTFADMNSLGIGYSFDLMQPALDLAPAFLPMRPDAAERLVSIQPYGPRLRIDFEVVATSLQGSQFVTTVRPVATALVTGETGDTVHFQETYVDGNASDNGAFAQAALKFLGPERAGVRVPEQPTGYPIRGIAPGMPLEEALEVLSHSFSIDEVSLSDGFLRAEHGVCQYAGVESREIESELGTICLVARVADDRISRVMLRQIVTTGLVSEFLGTWRESFGAADSRGDGAAPQDAIGREFLGWGAELDAPRTALGRAEVAMVSHEAELDITYLSPRASVVVARSDFATVSQGAAMAAAAPESAPTPVPEPLSNVEKENLSILGIRLGASRDAALEMLAKSDEIVYQVGFTASKPDAIDENADAIALANGDWFVLHYDTNTEPRKVIGVVRRIRVDSNVPMGAVREAMTSAYGAPTWEEASGGSWTEWHWRTDGSDAPCSLIDWRDGTMFAGAQTGERGDIKRVPMAQGRNGSNNRSFIQVADLVTFIDAVLTNSGSNQAALSTCPTALDATFMESTTGEHTILMRLVDPMAFDAASIAASATQPAASFNIQLK